MRIVSCLLCFVLFFSVSRAQRVKIPISASRWYQMTNANSSLEKLFDGDTKTVPFPGWSLMISPYEAYYPLLEGEQMTIDSLRMYDREGVYTNTPVLIYGITDQWERKLLGTFWGDRYLAWVGPYPTRPNTYKLDTAVSNIRYLMLRVYGNGFPAELELYGNYTAPASQASAPKPAHAPLRQMFGINGFAWNFVSQTGADIYITEQKLKGIKSFSGFRQYFDWQKSEPVEGRYYFSPQDGGGWPLDTIYKTAQEEQIEMVATFQSITKWINDTYPDSLKGMDNNPVRYGKSYSDPASYTEQAKLGFQFAARYGRNRNIDPSLVSVYTVPAWTGQKVNTKKIGLGLVKYIECGNEVDKTWRGRKGYLTGREYAANLSAFYDGHKGTLGPGVGVKAADSTMLLVMSGVSSISTDYFRGIIDWCKEFRGYKPDGSIDLCFDVVNYHLYSNNAASTSNGSATRGAAPEVTNCLSAAKMFIQASHDYLNDMPVWLTETGYDINQGSPYKAIAIGNRSASETQADWTLRTALLCAREGLQRCFFYQLLDFDVNYGGKFSSMGLLNKSDYSRKPAADFIYQTTNLFGQYRFQETLNKDPYVDRYDWNGQSMYALVVPDEVGRTTAYALQLPGADSAIIYTPMPGSDTMQQQKVATVDGVLSVTVTETPQFVVPVYTKLGNGGSAAIVNRQPWERGIVEPSGAKNVNVFPNPATDKLTIQNSAGGRWKVVLLNLQGNKVQEQQASGSNATVLLQQLPAGIYPLYIVNEKQELLLSQFVVKQ